MKKEIEAIQRKSLCSKETARLAFLALREYYLTELKETSKTNILEIVKLEKTTLPARDFPINGKIYKKEERANAKARVFKSTKDFLNSK